MKSDMERRTYDAELRVDAGGYGKKSSVIRGYAAKFNSMSEQMPIHDERGQQIATFRECLLPGCFTDAIKTSDVRCLINHDPDKLLGRNISGTLRLSEDSVGLRFENDVPDTSSARDAQISMQRGDMNQCSFGFRVSTEGESYRKDPDVANGYIREIRNVEKLFDVSVVTYPAYLDTNCDVAVRSIVGQMKEEEHRKIKVLEDEKEAVRQQALYIKRKQLELAEVSA